MIELLVIDLGESCVVKCLEGEIVLPVGGGKWRIAASWKADSIRICSTQIFYRSFEDVKKAIEETEEPPVPRIEITASGYVLHSKDVAPAIMRNVDYNAICELAGSPLPIWSGTSGEWTALIPPDEMVERGMPVQIWRYKR